MTDSTEQENDTEVALPAGAHDRLGAAFTQWQNTKKPEDLAQVVGLLKPVVDYKLGSLGVADNPRMRHTATLMAAEAIQRYDPGSGHKLTTWTQAHLRGMGRVKREQQGAVKVPDRAALDAWHLDKTTREFVDKHGREPDTLELADASKLSLARIEKVRKATRPVAATSQLYAEQASKPSYTDEALDYLYHDSDHIDRRILEMTVGYKGAQIRSKNEIAQMLGLSPATITRSTARMASKLQELESDLENV